MRKTSKRNWICICKKKNVDKTNVFFWKCRLEVVWKHITMHGVTPAINGYRFVGRRERVKN